MMKAAEKAAVKKAVQEKVCMKAPTNSSGEKDTEPDLKGSKVKRQALMLRPKRLPRVDIFLNPNKSEEVAAIAGKKQMVARNYFNKSNMKTLFPQLFQILWQSTLPCFRGHFLHFPYLL